MAAELSQPVQPQESLRRRPAAEGPRRVRASPHQVPDEIAQHPKLLEALQVLPSNYDFEIAKTIWRIQKARANRVALQFPEGLLMYAAVISDIISKFCPSLLPSTAQAEQDGGSQEPRNGAASADDWAVETVILGDVTYGACCVQDFTAKALGCDFLVHYGHSCLVPINVTEIPVMYVFVEIGIDVQHVIRTVKANFASEDHLVLGGTIQFAKSMRQIKNTLESYFEGGVSLPQSRPLSAGEVLGCTSPRLEHGGADQERRTSVLFLSDGRFHLESLMIHNPQLAGRFFQYNPYDKRLTLEQYDHEQMFEVRLKAIDEARQARKWGLILGTLGRQGNPLIVRRLEQLLRERSKEYVVVLLTEIFPDKLAAIKGVDAWIQVACPRLSVDWGYAFPAPLLSPYEAEVALQVSEWREVYPMDYYSYPAQGRQDVGGYERQGQAEGGWSNYNSMNDRGALLRRRERMLKQQQRELQQNIVGGSGAAVSSSGSGSATAALRERRRNRVKIRVEAAPSLQGEPQSHQE